MGLPWIRLDTAFPTNPKLLMMLAEKDGHRAGLVYLCSLAWAGAHGTGGLITSEALPFIHGRRPDAERLVRHGFWVGARGGWQINGWDEFQRVGEEELARRAQASQRASHAADIRWHGRRPDA